MLISKGFRVIGIIRPNPFPSRTLLLDFDQTPKSRNAITHALNRMGYKVKAFKSYRSTSGGRHVMVQIDHNLKRWQILALQFILGSDPNRERFNFQRLIHGQYGNFLFQRKLK